VRPPTIVEITAVAAAALAGGNTTGRAAAAVIKIPSARPTVRREHGFGIIAERVFPRAESV